jgi:hypothetical protein
MRMLDGQTWEHYHSEAGLLARLKAVRLAVEAGACYPPCGGEHCREVRAFMASPEFTGSPPSPSEPLR